MSDFLQVHPENPQSRNIRQAVNVLMAGGVIVYPTDSTYALGCHIGDKSALDRIRRIRQLSDDHNFTLVCSDLSSLSTYAVVNNSAYRILKAYTPGPYTFILKASPEVPRRPSPREPFVRPRRHRAYAPRPTRRRSPSHGCSERVPARRAKAAAVSVGVGTSWARSTGVESLPESSDLGLESFVPCTTSLSRFVRLERGKRFGGQFALQRPVVILIELAREEVILDVPQGQESDPLPSFGLGQLVIVSLERRMDPLHERLQDEEHHGSGDEHDTDGKHHPRIPRGLSRPPRRRVPSPRQPVPAGARDNVQPRDSLRRTNRQQL